MNFRLVSLALGGILLIVGTLMLVCLGYSAWGEPKPGPWVTDWLRCVVPTLAVGIVLMNLGRRADRTRIFRREAFAVVGLGWIVAGVFAALPYMILPPHAPVWDALFEAYSGLTTTGATIFTDLDQLSRGLLLWRSITQLIGGLGVVILFVAVLGFFGIGNKALFNRESSALADSEMGTRFQSLSFRYLMIYSAITLVGAVGLVIGGLTPYSAINHAMCAISTGGYSIHNESLGFYTGWHVHLWVVLLMMAGGIAFPVHYVLWIQRQWGTIRRNEELIVYIAAILLISTVIAIDLIVLWPGRNAPMSKLIVDSLFQTVSIMTTTGFGTADFNEWPPLSKFLLLGAMFAGGCAGSTAGGMKISRFIVFAKAALRQVRQAHRPHVVAKLRLNTKFLPEDAVQGVVMFFALYFVILLIGILGLAFLEPTLSMTTTLSAVIASVNNIGPGLAEVGPTHNFSIFNPLSKVWLSGFMLLGRLEIYAILLLILPSFWRKF